MSGNRGSGWNKLRNVVTAVRPEEGQTRGVERERQDNRPPPRDPPRSGRPAFGHPQQYSSDPGPYPGGVPWHDTQISPPQASSPFLHNQNYQGQYQAAPYPQVSSTLPHNHNYPGQHQTGYDSQGYGTLPAPHQYQPTQSQVYGQNQGYISPEPPAPYPQYHPGHGQQPSVSGQQSYPGAQGAYTHSYYQNTQRVAGSSYSPPLPPLPDRHNSQGPNKSPESITPSYPAQYRGGSLSRTLTAPPDFQCEHEYPGDRLQVAITFSLSGASY